MEVGAVGVLRRPAGPVDQAAVRTIDRIEPSGRGRAIDDHAEVAGRHASFTRQRALVVRRDAFNLPEREKQIRKEHRGPAEHAAKAADPPAGLVEVHDVRVLVREHQAEPVIGVPNRAVARRRGSRDLDQVVRRRRRPAVREVGLIHEDDVHAAARRAELRAELAGNLLGNARQAARERFLTLVEVDIEARRRDRPEAEAGIVPVRGVERAGQQRQQDGQRCQLPAPSSQLPARSSQLAQPSSSFPASSSRIQVQRGVARGASRYTSFRNVKSAIGESVTPCTPG